MKTSDTRAEDADRSSPSRGPRNSSAVERAKELQPELVCLRRSLHREPELGLHLPSTQEKVLRALDGLPLEVTLGSRLTSVTAVLRGGRPGAAVLLRGDMDALPVTEASGLEYASTVSGRMHACGHDLHTAGLVGAARLLAERREALHGDVVFMFQPGEEGHNGAMEMIEEGVLDAAGKPLAAAYALHVAAHRPRGMVVTRAGTLTSASDRLAVTIQGRGGHSSNPAMAKDPVPVACETVTAILTWVSRTVDVFDPAVVTVGSFHAGTQANVIPDTAEFEAVVRSYSEATRERLAEGLPHLVRTVATAHGLGAEVEFERGYPVTVNDTDETAFALATARDLFDPGQVWEAPRPANGSEDFAYVLQRVPGAMLSVGAAPKGIDWRSAPMNHSPRAVFDDHVLYQQAALLAELAERRLAKTAAAIGGSA